MRTGQYNNFEVISVEGFPSVLDFGTVEMKKVELFRFNEEDRISNYFIRFRRFHQDSNYPIYYDKQIEKKVGFNLPTGHHHYQILRNDVIHYPADNADPLARYDGAWWYYRIVHPEIKRLRITLPPEEGGGITVSVNVRWIEAETGYHGNILACRFKMIHDQLQFGVNRGTVSFYRNGKYFAKMVVQAIGVNSIPVPVSLNTELDLGCLDVKGETTVSIPILLKGPGRVRGHFYCPTLGIFEPADCACPDNEAEHLNILRISFDTLNLTSRTFDVELEYQSECPIAEARKQNIHLKYRLNRLDADPSLLIFKQHDDSDSVKTVLFSRASSEAIEIFPEPGKWHDYLAISTMDQQKIEIRRLGGIPQPDPSVLGLMFTDRNSGLKCKVFVIFLGGEK